MMIGKRARTGCRRLYWSRQSFVSWRSIANCSHTLGNPRLEYSPRLKNRVAMEIVLIKLS